MHKHTTFRIVALLVLSLCAAGAPPAAEAQLLPPRTVGPLPPDAMRQFQPAAVDCRTADPFVGQTVECFATPADSTRWTIDWVVERIDGRNRADDVQAMRPVSDVHSMFRIYRAGRYEVKYRFVRADSPASRVVEAAPWPLEVRKEPRWYRSKWLWSAVTIGGIGAGAYFYCNATVKRCSW